MVLDLFLAGAVVLWLSVFGYPLALAVLSRGRRRGPAPKAPLPPIAVVVPTLDEESLIAGKLADLARTDYPLDRLMVVVADGGSRDRTREIVQAHPTAGGAVRLLRVAGCAGQADQVCRALDTLPHEIVVVTDADARLEPGCVRALVEELRADPGLAVAGALVRPHTALLEERLYWWALNHLWRLEGEALSCAMVSGACYAVRRATVEASCRSARALDVSLAAGAAARGLAARLCRTARATEVRVPQTAGDFLAFRRRRGAGYLQALQAAPGRAAPLRWRVARAMRLWHLRVVPRFAAAVLLLAVPLLGTPDWRWAVPALAAFVAPVLLLAGVAGAREGSWWRAALASGRLLALTWVALLALAPAPPRPLAPERTA